MFAQKFFVPTRLDSMHQLDYISMPQLCFQGYFSTNNFCRFKFHDLEVKDEKKRT